MSAWICSNKHISAILGAYAAARRHGLPRTEITEEDATALGQLLLDENYRSVNHRYDENDRGRFRLAKATYRAPPEPVAALKLCMSLDYQSCECDDWQRTEAYYLLRKIIDVLVRALPGYDDAEWSI
jgi:hypothetical protein